MLDPDLFAAWFRIGGRVSLMEPVSGAIILTLLWLTIVRATGMSGPVQRS